MNNPQAFPNPHLRGDSGITMRDYFAARAMQSILYADRAAGLVGVNLYEHKCAEDAYMVANAMMKAREE
jgi:hypothetical protein